MSFEYRAQYWKPSVGDTVEGTIAEVTVEHSQFKDANGEFRKFPVLTIKQDETGEPIKVRVNHGSLFKKLAPRKPTAGTRLGIKYLGKAGQESTSPHRYEVAFEGDTVEPRESYEWSNDESGF